MVVFSAATVRNSKQFGENSCYCCSQDEREQYRHQPNRARPVPHIEAAEQKVARYNARKCSEHYDSKKSEFLADRHIAPKQNGSILPG
jgi:hypothetical protein